MSDEWTPIPFDLGEEAERLGIKLESIEVSHPAIVTRMIDLKTDLQRYLGSQDQRGEGDE